MKLKLFIPGPIEVSQEVLLSVAKPLMDIEPRTLKKFYWNAGAYSSKYLKQKMIP